MPSRGEIPHLVEDDFLSEANFQPARNALSFKDGDQQEVGVRPSHGFDEVSGIALA